MFKLTDLEWDTHSGLASQCQISIHCVSGIDGHELKAGPATFALADVLSFWFTRIKNSQGYHWSCTCILGLKYKLVSASGKLLAQHLPFSAWHHLPPPFLRHPNPTTSASAVGEKVQDSERNDCQQPLNISWKVKQLLSYNLLAHIIMYKQVLNSYQLSPANLLVSIVHSQDCWAMAGVSSV